MATFVAESMKQCSPNGLQARQRFQCGFSIQEAYAGPTICTSIPLRPAEERIKAIQSAELAKKKAAEAAEAAEAHRAYLAQLPVLFNGSEQIFVGSDRKCSQQFIEAISMEGLEKRKRIADLVSYGCGFTVPAGTHVKVSQKAASFVEVSIVEGQHNAKSGWVPVGWVK